LADRAALGVDSRLGQAEPAKGPENSISQPEELAVMARLRTAPRRSASVRAIAVSVLSAVGLAASMTVAPAAQATFAGAPGRIAFVKAGDIYTVRPDGTGTRRLTRTGDNARPAWNASGTRLAFDSARSGNRDVYVMNADGSRVVQITKRETSEAAPSWSPNGSDLAFVSDRTGVYEVYRIPISPLTHPTQLTVNTEAERGLGWFHTVWTPDGRTIFGNVNFALYSDGADIDLARFSAVDGSNLSYFGPPCGCYSLDINPAGTRLAFTDDDPLNDAINGFVSNVFTSNLDASARRPVTHDVHHEGRYDELFNDAPSWSPDGTKIAYGHYDGHGTGNSPTGVYVVKPDGTRSHLVAAGGSDPAWQPRP